MTVEPLRWEGEILFGNEADKRKLRRLGVSLIREVEGGAYFCRMSEETLQKLNPRWGEFFWSLRPIQKESNV